MSLLNYGKLFTMTRNMSTLLSTRNTKFLTEMAELYNSHCAVAIDGFSLLWFMSFLPLQPAHKQEIHTVVRSEGTVLGRRDWALN